mmetsp:Transcript_91147/g.162269  ORF Transcript_91147/g.162269 Transcript_91147/m.162269 type:complete len:542 (-) Transcript_91147:95-1720(-)
MAEDTAYWEEAADYSQEDAGYDQETEGMADETAVAESETTADAKVATPQSKPSAKKVLVLGDENLLYSAGLQESYPEVEFTAATVLSRLNLDSREFKSMPPALQNRVRHAVDPTKIDKQFAPASFDDLVLFLPGLSFAVPKEMGTSDRPIFAYRTHHFVFHVLRAGKQLLKGEGHLHLVWPEETSLMSSPCGAAGLELPQLLSFLGCRQVEAKFSAEKVNSDNLWPIVFGEVPTEVPEWIHGVQIHSFNVDNKPIEIPLCVALQLHPDLSLVSIKDPSPKSGGAASAPAASAPLKAKLIHEALARKEKLKEIYGRKDSSNGEAPILDLVKEPVAQESLLCMPLEAFMLAFEEVPHIAQCMKFQIFDDQPPVTVVTIAAVDPRMPTRVARPASVGPATATAMGALTPVQAAAGPLRKRSRPKDEEWGEMKFYCPLTKIATPTAEKMRAHMSGDLYKRLATSNPGWLTSEDKKDLMLDLEIDAAEEQAKRAKREAAAGGKGSAKGKGKGDGKSKGGGKSGGKNKSKDEKGKGKGKSDGKGKHK